MANPNPSPDTRFGGKRGNPNGKTSEQKRLELENAERALRIRDRVLRAWEAKLNESDMDGVVELTDAAMLKLLKDSEDRGLGNPVQPHSGPNGESLVSRIVIEAADDNRDNQAPA